MDFDWDDMAMMLGMAEEIAAEEARQAEFEEAEPDVAFPDDDPVPAGRRRRGPVRRSAFEQYVDDICMGRKEVHDPMLGPSRSPRIRRRLGARAADTRLWGVKIENAALASEKFLEFLYTALDAFRDQHELRTIALRTDGEPIVDGRAIFATMDAGNRRIDLNLRRHREIALVLAEHENTDFSLNALIWTSMTTCFLHELYHAIETERIGSDHRLDPQREAHADGFAKEVDTWLHQNGGLEPAPLTREPYFGPPLIRYTDRAAAEGWHWARRQQTMMHEGLLFWNEAEDIRIHQLSEYYRLSLAGQHAGDPLGERLNRCIMERNFQEDAAWRRDDRCQALLDRAAAEGRWVTMRCRVAQDRTEVRRLQPIRTWDGDGFRWVEALPEDGAEPIRLRIDQLRPVASDDS